MLSWLFEDKAHVDSQSASPGPSGLTPPTLRELAMSKLFLLKRTTQAHSLMGGTNALQQPRAPGFFSGLSGASGINKRPPLWLLVAGALGVGIVVNIIMSVGLGSYWEQEFCAIGWLPNSGRCYYFSRRKNSWEESRKFCETQDAEMLMIKDEETLNFIRQHSSGLGYFTGLKREGSAWKWIDGTVLDKFIHLQREGDNLDCGRVTSGNFWQEDCTKHFQWICEKYGYKFQKIMEVLIPASEHENSSSSSSTE